ncbi:hypothetical protein [Myxococcus stipitatus]|uniref:hypothetical protein n=1 Tax=Myxococcus stipitatus TaxID=83455 RepID=UPI0030CD5E30
MAYFSCFSIDSTSRATRRRAPVLSEAVHQHVRHLLDEWRHAGDALCREATVQQSPQSGVPGGSRLSSTRAMRKPCATKSFASSVSCVPLINMSRFEVTADVTPPRGEQQLIHCVEPELVVSCGVRVRGGEDEVWLVPTRQERSVNNRAQVLDE